MILTVDWDYFVPLDPYKHDFGHAETPFFLNHVWAMRGQFVDDIRTTGEELTFWNEVRQSVYIKPRTFLGVSDSHLDVMNIRGFPYTQTIINVDAHHDCWSLREELGDLVVDCSSWGTAFLKRGRNHRLIWVRPEHSTCDLETADDSVRDQITVVDSLTGVWHEFKPGKKAEIGDVHVCRSGCWTPPWLDNDFVQFIDRKWTGLPPYTANYNREEIWQAKQPRWTQAQINEARGFAASCFDAAKSLKQQPMMKIRRVK